MLFAEICKLFFNFLQQQAIGASILMPPIALLKREFIEAYSQLYVRQAGLEPARPLRVNGF